MRFSAKRVLPFLLLGLSIWFGLLILPQLIPPIETPRAMVSQTVNANDPPLGITVSDRVVGFSTRYIGAVEGNIAFNSADLSDLGINTYRIYGGMSRWESEDDDGVYGWPPIEAIKADPNVVNWAFWDRTMTRPNYGSDYSWSGRVGDVWMGSASTIFSTLKALNIRPVLTLRNVDNSQNPRWAQQLNPPTTTADWNEWWEHVFATVYWLNVRNDFRVDEFEIHNEPDNRAQGWRGTVEDYYELVRVSKDAIDHVYRTYLPDRQYAIHAPVSLGGSVWPFKALRDIPALFSSLNVHNYDTDISVYVKKVRDWANRYNHAQFPLWLGEWGSYTNDYGNHAFALNLINNMMRASQPSSSYVFGSHIFSLYDWGLKGKHQGLIGSGGKRQRSYYAFRMGIRALQGGKAVLALTLGQEQLMVMATRADDGHLFVLMVNSEGEPHKVMVDVSAHLQTGQGQRWEFSRDRTDELTDAPVVQQGMVETLVPAESTVLIELVPGPG